MRLKRGMVPFTLLRRHDVGVGIEENGREGRVSPGPLEEQQGLPLGELENLRIEGEGFGLGSDEIGGFVVAGIGM